MKYLNFLSYLRDFENMVVLGGIKRKCLGSIERVPIRRGKLAHWKFGRLVGQRTNHLEPYAIDYYGHIKKSEGLFLLVEEIRKEIGGQMKSIDVPVVHFAAVKIEKVANTKKPILG